MKAFRLFFRDRLLAGASVALVIYLLIFQSLLVGIAHGSMAAMGGDSLGVICVADGSASADRSFPAHGPETDRAHYPCAVPCQFASGVAAASPATQPDFACIVRFSTIVVHPDRPDLFQPVARVLAGEPRAPPHLSV